MNAENNRSHLLNSPSIVGHEGVKSPEKANLKGHKIVAESKQSTSVMSVAKNMFSVTTSFFGSKVASFLAGDYDDYFKSNVEKSKSIINEHTSEDLQTQIDKFVPKIADFLFEQLKSSLSYGVVQETYLRQKNFILKALETNLYRVLANVVEKTSLSLEKKEIDLSDIFIEINKFLGEECQKALHDLMNDDISEEHFDKLLSPFKQNFLAYLFPNGEKDFVLPEGNVIQFVKRMVFSYVPDFLPIIFKSLFKENKLNANYIKVNIQKDLSKEEYEYISRKSDFVAKAIVEKVKSAKIQITSDEQLQALMDKELDVLKNNEIFNQTTIPFIEQLLGGIVTRIIGVHVLKYNKLHKDDQSYDAMTKFSLQLVDLLDKCISKLDEKFFEKLQDLDDPANREFVLKKIEPLIVKILKTSGFENEDSLPLPNLPVNVKTYTWQLLTKDYLPNLIVDQLKNLMLLKVEQREEVAQLKDGEMFASFIKACSKKALPLLQEHLTSNADSYADDISKRIDMPQILDKTSIKNILEVISSGNERAVKNVLSYLPDIFNQFVSPLLLNFASKENKESKSTLKNIASHLLNLIKGTQTDIEISTDPFKLFNEAESFNLDVTDLKNPLHVDLMKYLHGKTFFTDETSLDEKTKNIMYEIYFGKTVDTFFKDMGVEKERLPQYLREYLLKASYQLFNLLNGPLDRKNEYQISLYSLFGIDDNSFKSDLKHLKDQSKDYPIIESAINFSAELIQKEIKTYLKDNPAKITASLDLDAEMENWFGDSLREFENSKIADDVWSYSLDVLKATVTKVFIDVSKISQQPNSAVDPKKVLPNFLTKISNLFTDEIKKIDTQYKDIVQIKDQNERNERLRELFTPLSSKVLNLAGSNLLDAMPIPEGIRNTILDSLEKQILPDILASLYDNIALWHNSSDVDEKKLMDLFIKDKPKVFKDTAGIIARFTSDFLPAFLQNPQNEMAIVLRDKLIHFMLQQSGSDAEKLQQYLDDNKDEVEEIVREHLDALFQEDSVFLEESKAGFERYIEVVAVKMMSNLFENVNRLQTKKDFYIDLGLELVGICNQHFGKLVDIMKNNERDVAYKIDKSVLKSEYDIFHKALDPNNKQENSEIENFYKPFAKRVLQLANVSRDQLPVPESVRDQVFEMLQNQLGPLLLEKIMESIDVDKILLSMLKSLNEESDTVTNNKVHVLQKDETQQVINKACGDLFLNLIRLIPSPGVQSLFEKSLKKTTSEALGFIFRTELTDVNFTHVISDSLSKLMLNLNDQIKMDDQGNLIVPDDLKFDFPKTISQSNALDIASLKEKEKTQKLLIKELSKTVGMQIKNRVSNFFAEPWRKIQVKLDEWLTKIFGPRAVEFKIKISKYLENVFINIMLALLYLITLPVALIVNRVLLEKAKDVTKTLHMDIHKNLVFNLVDATLRYLENVGDSIVDEDTSNSEMPNDEIPQDVNFN